ncbi:MAG: NTPase (NACHT family)-like protein [Cytophagales bacterium CG18_big_fil_WC_8_21_14_2_50_42_9]|nr:MAG: NTPase (NACHT family)-like protein [Cytophagales bacterium CG18_big_fil_WC_8_21_14_2_50_42_9]
MDYLFENIGDERFQEFCHSLITKEFPNSQALPVGQPDGGRDSLVYNLQSSERDFLVFQVKYVRNPFQEKDPHKWLVSTIAGEIEKIKLLIPKGAKGYYLLTNIKGTAHLNNGSIDKLDKILKDNIDIPVMCWWRDDLSRRLENNPLLKWSYPEILSGLDILSSLVFQNINENKERRESTIKSYLGDQYDIDKEVKFKQIELQNRLLDLYVDVPLKIKKYNGRNRKIQNALSRILYKHRYLANYEFYYSDERESIGAASFLLNPDVQNNIDKILLEGGPGQGKSTISQYICQIHRIRLLEKKSDFESLPSHIQNVPVRLPFKIDLRDFASWAENKNPYPDSFNEEYFKSVWKKSLESFLVTHICYHSKFDDFTISDFAAICRLSSILLVFDGFDEIANINIREEIIDLINRGISRISEYCKSIQVLITSRPAAFSNSVEFSSEVYPHFELTNITPANTKEYVEKWINSRTLRPRVASDIRRLVEEKLQMPHLRDLSKSPMQLAILISLLNTRGDSLPNKRTALYDSYIELFFNRESEKDPIIRDKRDLIIDIHQYLAWILHSEAELYGNNGRIEINILTKRLKEYLDSEGHATDIADKLFTVMQERVCALVSRVQGTFEFEVQPLREYFCARYLYNTSPHSPAGNEKSGTKPDRFEAMSRNFYWQNVVRFFSGCFGKGELATLILKLQELQEDDYLKYTNYPRLLTSQLLSDYVFTQYPKSLKTVIKIIIDGLNIGAILNQDERNSNNEPIILPEECGREELITECFIKLQTFPANDYASELISIIINNPYNVLNFWKLFAIQISGESLTNWIEYGYRLQIIHKIEPEFLMDLINKEPLNNDRRIQIFIKGNLYDFININPELKEIVLNGILDGKYFLYQRRSKNYTFTYLANFINPFILASIFSAEGASLSLEKYINHRYIGLRHDDNDFLSFQTADALDSNIKEFLNKITKSIATNIIEWKSSLEPWDLIVETGRSIFGERNIFYLIAIISGGIKSKTEKFEEFNNLHDESVSLCKRIRNARLKSGNILWWKFQIESSTNILFTLSVFFTWATPKTLLSLIDLLSQRINSLKSKDLEYLINNLETLTNNSDLGKVQEKLFINQISNLSISDTLKFILILRVSESQKKKFIYNNYQNYSGDIQQILTLKLQYLIESFFLDPTNIKILNETKDVYFKVKILVVVKKV